jgi:hypothetical protein
MSAQLLWYLHLCMMISSTVQCLQSSIMSYLLYDVCLHLLCLATCTVEVIKKNTSSLVNFATLYMSGKVILNYIFSLFYRVMILINMFSRLGNLKSPVNSYIFVLIYAPFHVHAADLYVHVHVFVYAVVGIDTFKCNGVLLSSVSYLINSSFRYF